jgi:heat shock protein HtpX
MPTETFNTLIAKNKRNSFFLIALFMVFFVALGLVIGVAWGGYTDEAGVYNPNWIFAIVVAAIAAVVAFCMTTGSYFAGGNAILAISHAKEIKKSDDPQLFNVVEELSLAAGQPIPKIYVIDDTAMNAFATGRNPKNASVAITIGLRQKLNRDELQGVMAHEMSHIRNYDILYATMMAVMVGCLVMLCDIFLRSVFWSSMTGGRRRRSNNDSGGGAAQLIMMIVAILLAILAPILAKIIQMSLSRQREYLADAGAVELTRNPDGLASALVRLTDDNEVLEAANRATAPLYIVNPIKKFEERSKHIFDTHPAIEDRVKRLKSLTV